MNGGQATCVAGVDEVGRGPLAGPVVTAAVILPDNYELVGLTDSKKLTARRRQALAAQIRADAVACCVASASVAEIDRLNILHATMLAMQRALAALEPPPQQAWIDGNRAPDVAMPTRTFVGGDARIAVISAASIVAKVERDRQMVALDAEYPGYGFARHKGYGTKAHREALAALGPTPVHRRSFAPVRRALSVERERV